MSTYIVLQQMGVIVILVAIGILLYKRKIVDNTVSPKISAIVMDICNPALIMASILSGNIEASHSDLAEAMVLGFAFYACLVILGIILPLVLRVKKDKRRFYNLMTVYTNVGFIGIPLAKTILPEKAIIYVIVCNVMYSLLFYTHGITVLSDGREKINIKKIFSPGTVMAILALVVCWFNISLPPIIANSISYVGNATVFLSMMLLGVAIARSDMTKGFKEIRVWGYIIIRMIIVPVAIFFALSGAGFEPVTVLGLCLMAMMPVGNLPLIQSEKMGEDTEILSGAITVTTIMSVLTIPLLMILFTNI
ncbi:MAG: AEC family transporter [Lachnospiraceae bacterium]|nr:AEC family transporter [Lachnospiraceae bacterium]